MKSLIFKAWSVYVYIKYIFIYVFIYKYKQRNIYTESEKYIILKCSLIKTTKLHRYGEIIVTGFELSNHYNTWMQKNKSVLKNNKNSGTYSKIHLGDMLHHLKP